MKFYHCQNCNEIVIFRNEAKSIKCCEEEMVELLPNQNEEEASNHKLIVRKFGNLVTVLVGETPHPMVDVHNIDFIILETDKGFYYKKLNISEDAIADFLIHNQETLKRVYAYCNIHNLWMTGVVNDYTKDN